MCPVALGLDAEEEYTLYYDARRRIEATRQLKHWSSAVERSIKLGTVSYSVFQPFSSSAVQALIQSGEKKMIIVDIGSTTTRAFAEGSYQSSLRAERKEAR